MSQRQAKSVSRIAQAATESSTKTLEPTPIVGEHNIAFTGGRSTVPSDAQVHGLYAEDIEEGIRCGECVRIAAVSRKSYKVVIIDFHGVEPKDTGQPS